MKRLTLFALLIVSVPILQGCDPDSNDPRYIRADASADAREWAAQTHPTWKINGVTGRNEDTDGDGYVTQEVGFTKPTGEEVSIVLTCGYTQANHGCTTYQSKPPVVLQ